MSEVLAEYRVDSSDPLRPLVTVNGETVQHLQRVSLDAHVGDMPHLFVELAAGAGVLEGVGIVVQKVPIPADATEVLGEFFDSLDPAELEREMLEQFGMLGNSTTTGEACLAVLRKWVANYG